VVHSSLGETESFEILPDGALQLLDELGRAVRPPAQTSAASQPDYRLAREPQAYVLWARIGCGHLHAGARAGPLSALRQHGPIRGGDDRALEVAGALARLRSVAGRRCSPHPALWKLRPSPAAPWARPRDSETRECDGGGAGRRLRSHCDAGHAEVGPGWGGPDCREPARWRPEVAKRVDGSVDRHSVGADRTGQRTGSGRSRRARGDIRFMTGGRVAGFSGCNRFSGSYTLEGGCCGLERWP